jgi:hypothetical protein
VWRLGGDDADDGRIDASRRLCARASGTGSDVPVSVYVGMGGLHGLLPHSGR